MDLRRALRLRRVPSLNDMMTMQGDSSDEDNEDGDEGSDEE